MTYIVKEVFYTLQGEGAQAGRPAVFLRFSGCNLWSGQERDRGKGPGSCSCWCDTNFVGVDGPSGGKYPTASALGKAVLSVLHGSGKSIAPTLIVCTGGEPLLQLDRALIDELHTLGFEIAVETNGTLPVPDSIDWLCVSPKSGSLPIIHSGDELKLVFPQKDVDPSQFEGWEFRHWYLQPRDDDARQKNTSLAVEYCKLHPRWRLSSQTHKYLGIP